MVMWFVGSVPLSIAVGDEYRVSPQLLFGTTLAIGISAIANAPRIFLVCLKRVNAVTLVMIFAVLLYVAVLLTTLNPVHRVLVASSTSSVFMLVVGTLLVYQSLASVTRNP